MFYTYKTTQHETPARLVVDNSEQTFQIVEEKSYYVVVQYETTQLKAGKHVARFYNEKNEILNTVIFYL